jgi:hypothetical protein
VHSFALVRPGGRDCYPAFWIRDFAMSLESGFISPVEILNHLRLTAEKQNGPQTRYLKNGLQIPPYAIADHINFDGSAAFYPGTMNSGDDQGDGNFGHLPPADDHFEFIHMAYVLHARTQSADFLNEIINGLSIIDRLVFAFESPVSDPATEMVTTTESLRTVGFGFCDTIHMTGDLLFASILRYRAAKELSELCRSLHRNDQAAGFDRIAATIRKNLTTVFADTEKNEGWLLAATKVCRQPDIWGTLYALYLNLLDGEGKSRAVQAVIDAVRAKTIVCQGALRHVPVNRDFSADSSWEKTAGVARNQYQNGAWWHTPTGWLIAVLASTAPDLARTVFEQYIDHLRVGDFRKGSSFGSPWECFYDETNWWQNPVYMTSVTLPYAVIVQHM